MSCFHPITIYNNSLNFNPSAFRVSLQVPCGHCEACRALKAFQLKTRCYYETLDCRHHGGIAICDTLTYRPEDLPMRNGVPIFSHDDLIGYKKRLRINLARRFPEQYAALPEGVPSLRLLIVSEYGGWYHRPHYHVIIWCYVQGVSVHDLSVLSHDAWGHGFTDYVDEDTSHKTGRKMQPCKQVWFDDPVSAAKYVCDYVSVSGDEVLTEHDFLNSVYLGRMKQKNYQEYLQVARLPEYKPRMWTSNGLGSFFLSCLVDDDCAAEVGLTAAEIKNHFDLTHGIAIPNVKNGFDFCPCGHYYGYKLFFDRVYNERTGRKDRFVLNEYGIAARCGSIQKQIDSCAEVIAQAFGLIENNDKEFADAVLSRVGGFRPLARYEVLQRGRVIIADQMLADELEDDYRLCELQIRPDLATHDNPLKNDDITQDEKRRIIEDWSRYIQQGCDVEIEALLSLCYAAYDKYVTRKKEHDKIELQRMKYIMRKCHADKQYNQFYSTH